MADADLEIGAHAHREFRDVVARGDVRQQREVRPGRLAHRRNAHQPLHGEAQSAATFGQESIRANRGDAGFLRLLACIDLDIESWRSAGPLDLVGELPCQPGPVEGLDDMEQRHRVANLVGLQRADESQFETIGSAAPPAGGLPHPVFSEDPLARRQHRLDGRPGLLFGDGGQGDGGGIAPAGKGRVADSRLNCDQRRWRDITPVQ